MRSHNIRGSCDENELREWTNAVSLAHAQTFDQCVGKPRVWSPDLKNTVTVNFFTVSVKMPKI